MPEIGSSGLMSGDGKRGVGHRPQATAPILDSTNRDMGLISNRDMVRGRTGSVLSVLYVQPRDRFKIVDWIIFDHGDANFQRHGDGLGQIAANQEIHRQEQSAGLPRNRIAVVDTDVWIWIKSHEP